MEVSSSFIISKGSSLGSEPIFENLSVIISNDSHLFPFPSVSLYCYFRLPGLFLSMHNDDNGVPS